MIKITVALENNMKQLADIIFGLSGDKIITLNNNDQCWQYAFNKNTKNAEGQELLFRAKLLNVMNRRGSIVVRQFTNLKNNGVTICKIYGIALFNNEWFPISAKEMEEAYCTDAATGKRLPKDNYVIFEALKKEDNPKISH